MAKPTSVFVCQSCGSQAPKWLGRCPECEAWNTFAEEPLAAPAQKGRSAARSAAAQPITEISGLAVERLSTGIGELDRTLGGGLVAGSLTLVGGEPGIGKSTLILQSMGRMAQAGKKVLYVTGEESPAQIKLRAERLHCVSQNLIVCSEICIEEILSLLDQVRPDVLVLDSIQTFYTRELPSAPGSVGQVKEVAFKIFQEIKARSLPVFLIGHITKDGAIAGPKTLEHIVDTVIYFEGERAHAYRILRAVKNRYGATPEIGVFEMTGAGLAAVDNPSEIFLAERPEHSPGSVIVSSMEGSRSLFVEIQALVSTSTNVGMPRRMAAGLDYNRMSLLIAIMEKRLDIHLQGEDIFVNVAGGIKVNEPAVDLGMAAAIAGSFRNRAIDPHTVMIGEVGLTGEVRSVLQLEPRIAEAERLGFKRCIVPAAAQKADFASQAAVELCFAKTLAEAFDRVL